MMGRTPDPRWVTVRKLILRRDDWCCARCGNEATDVHHRKLKGMGGTRDEETAYGYANLISVCRFCHSWIHAHPTDSYNAGYLVHSWEYPEHTFIITKHGMLTLRADGTSDLQGLYDDPYF